MAKDNAAAVKADPMELVTVEITAETHSHWHPDVVAGESVERVYKKGDRFQVERHFAESIVAMKAGQIVG